MTDIHFHPSTASQLRAMPIDTRRAVINLIAAHTESNAPRVPHRIVGRENTWRINAGALRVTYRTEPAGGVTVLTVSTRRDSYLRISRPPKNLRGSRIMTKTIVSLRHLIPKPLVITLGNLKGGAAKTTSSFFLACYFALVHGLKVLVIDADPLSQTGDSWFRRLVEGGVDVPFALIPFPSKHVGRCITDNSGSYDVIIVDAGGESDEIFKAAVMMTNELILTTSCNPSEYNRIPGTFLAAAEAAARVEHSIQVRVLMTKVPVVMKRNKEGEIKNVSTEYLKARRYLEDADYEVFERYARNWMWYREAADGGVGDGAENPIEDLGEYREIGDELIAPYLASGDSEVDADQSPATDGSVTEVSL